MNKVILILACCFGTTMVAAEEPTIHPSTGNLLTSSTQSSRCIECHDAIVIKDDKSPIQFSGQQTINHPIGFSYSDYASTMPSDYVSGMNLDSRIKLEDGEVGCIACHELRTDPNPEGCTSPGKLTVGPKKSDLCVSCHNM